MKYLGLGLEAEEGAKAGRAHVYDGVRVADLLQVLLQDLAALLVVVDVVVLFVEDGVGGDRE